MTSPIVALDDAETNRVLLFRNPLQVLRADTQAAVPAVLEAMRSALSDARHLAGYASYEFGHVLEPRLSRLVPQTAAVPLIWFAVFDTGPVVLEGDDLAAFWSDGRYHAGRLRSEWSRADYVQRFHATQALIEAGDIFQANLTFRARFQFRGDVRAFYRDLRAQGQARHGALIHDGDRDILSASPELFFAIEPSGVIRTAPMKGTISRDGDPALDELRRLELANSVKDRAENLMIVDLLRNDLGRLADIGSVSVDKLFAVETYPTLHTMVSHVSARLPGRCEPETILRALFPCGSVTGAPKIRAMEIIGELEGSARGVYCGAIGHFAPDGSAKFNVAIRTITIADGRGELGIGGAVTTDSTAEGEWSESHLKAQFFERARRPVELIETLRFEAGAFHRLDQHLARMADSAAVFEIPFDLTAARKALEVSVSGQIATVRCRLTLDEDGRFRATAVPLGSTKPVWLCAIAPTRVHSDDVFLRHKTGWRDVYDGERERMAQRLGVDEVLFLNERDELCEGSRSNLFLQIGSDLLTPARASGLLSGCLRQELLDSGVVRERVLRLSDLARAERLMIGNSLRGLVPIELIKNQSAVLDRRMSTVHGRVSTLSASRSFLAE